MERKKEIEEMLKDICVIIGTKCLLNVGGHCIDCKYVKDDNIDHDCQSVLVADELTNQGYRKIPNGAVVLTKEEYIRLASYISEERAREIFHEETEKLKEAIRKETAREILDEVAKHYGGSWLVELYRKYGVEVE